MKGILDLKFSLPLFFHQPPSILLLVAGVDARFHITCKNNETLNFKLRVISIVKTNERETYVRFG